MWLIIGLVSGLTGCMVGIIMTIAAALPAPSPSKPILPAVVESSRVVEPPEAPRFDDDLAPCSAVVYLEPGQRCASD